MPGVRKAAQNFARSRSPVTRVSRARFGRDRRLTQSSQFSHVLARSRRSSDRYFTVLSQPNALNTARLGLTVSRRAARLAVDRNRIKRISREAFRLTPLPPQDFVVMARAAAAHAANPELRASLEAHFARLARTPVAAPRH